MIDQHKYFNIVAGAPVHISTILKKNNLNTELLTAIGDDKNGKKILNFLKKKKINTSNILIKKNYKTGLSIVNSHKNKNTFKIKNLSAWDFLDHRVNFTPHLLYFGSIVSRSNINIKTLNKIIKKNIKYIFFDLNLRLPHINWVFTKKILTSKITHLKLSIEEYKYINKEFNNSYTVKKLFKKNKNLKFIAVTNNYKGCEIYFRNNISLIYKNIKKIKIINSVGAGDVFTSYLIKSIVRNEDIISGFEEAITNSTNSVSKIGID